MRYDPLGAQPDLLEAEHGDTESEADSTESANLIYLELPDGVGRDDETQRQASDQYLSQRAYDERAALPALTSRGSWCASPHLRTSAETPSGKDSPERPTCSLLKT